MSEGAEHVSEYVGKPFDEPETVTLGYIIKVTDVPGDERGEALKMCSNCASPKDVLRAQSFLSDDQQFGSAIPYLTCDYCDRQMRPETTEEVDQDAVEELWLESNQHHDGHTETEQ